VLTTSKGNFFPLPFDKKNLQKKKKTIKRNNSIKTNNMVVGGDNLKQQLKFNGGSNNFIVDGGDAFITMSAVMFASNG